MRRVFFLLLVASFALITSCEIDDDVNHHFEALQVKSVEMPEAFDYGEIYKIKVTYFRPNNCTFFEGFDVVKEDLTTRKVVTIGTVIEDLWWTQGEEIALHELFIEAMDDHRKQQMLGLQKRRIEITQKLEELKVKLKTTVRDTFEIRSVSASES